MLRPNAFEVKEKRTYTSKLFEHSDGLKTLCAAVGHQHYLNKLGVGDGRAGLREIGWDLSWDDYRRGWYFNFHSFHPFIPEFADQPIIFRDVFQGKDQEVSFVARCGHVRGRLVDEAHLKSECLWLLTDSNCIIYDDAFENGVDLVVYFTRSTLRKCARIRTKTVKDYTFEFGVSFPEDSTIWRVSHDEYELDLSRGKTFDSSRRTEIRTSDGTTFFKPFLIWDDQRTVTARVDFFLEDGNLILRKNVPKEFIEGSTGFVFTDTTTSYYSGAGDGRVYNENGNGNVTWSTLYSAAGTNAEYTSATSQSPNITSTSTSNQFNWMGLWFFQADTSGIGTSSVIQSATLNVYASTTQTNLGNLNWNVIQATTAASTTLATSDLQNTMANTTRFVAADSSISGVSTSAYTVLTMNASGLAAISKSGYTKYAISLANQIDNSAPTWISNVQSNITWNNSEQTGTSKDPYVSVTFITPTPGLLMNIM